MDTVFIKAAIVKYVQFVKASSSQKKNGLDNLALQPAEL